jgi:uncharacterized protein
MSDPIESVNDKVLAVFGELVGERASRLDGSVLASSAIDAATAALTSDYGEAKAANIALHMADWNWDAAFVVALHLFPERFSPEEIDAGIGLFLWHAPNHIREACRLTNTYVWESFPEENEIIPEFELSLPSIAVRQFPGKGRGVVAERHFEPDEIVERLPVIVIPHDEVSLICQTRLAHYYFEWGDDCKQAAIALGYGSLYNHAYTPNARYEFRESEECLEFIALREIQPGEEITINYNNLGPSAKQPLKFDVRE